eukprot:TRINITY_DN34544_c0_g1_i1.p1 TRINITY_DN34544_c0_g1~~TRINITY_DN34544_c0_g1_i1.p1  ORF type:complete len:565 (-),score=128.12 TRINITY_DN34544_c0_g1_i1:221-1915(-)
MQRRATRRLYSGSLGKVVGNAVLTNTEAVKQQDRRSVRQSSQEGCQEPEQTVPVVSVPVDPFDAVAADAAILERLSERAVETALMGKYRELLHKVFDLVESSSGLQDALANAKKQAARNAARELAQVVKGPVLIPKWEWPPVALQVFEQVASSAAGGSCGGPAQLVEATAEALRSVRASEKACLRTAEGLAKAVSYCKGMWAPIAESSDERGFCAVVLSKVSSEAEEQQYLVQSCEHRWQTQSDAVDGFRIKFEADGFAEKAGCCAVLQGEMHSGLRGLMVHRALRAATKGLEAYRACAAETGWVSCTGPDTACQLLSRARTDMLRRVKALQEVVAREIQDVQKFAVRGHLPDNRRPPPQAVEECRDLWSSTSEEDAIAVLMEAVSQRPQAAAVSNSQPGKAAGLEDGVIMTIAKFDRLTAFVGSIREKLTQLGESHHFVHCRDEGVKKAFGSLCGATSSALRELSVLHEGLLEVLDTAVDEEEEAAISAAKAWSTNWCGCEDADDEFSRLAEAIVCSGPQLTHLPGPLEPRRPLFRGLRGMALLLADSALREQVVPPVVSLLA